jgi:gamma-glutamyl-gamma-aminobutyraldehyde dehydrogenase
VTTEILTPTPPTSAVGSPRAAAPARITGMVCRHCGHQQPLAVAYVCPACFGPLEVAYDYAVVAETLTREAIAIANDTSYGLAASLYTDDLNVAHRVARELKAGTVGVNAYAEGDMTTPFGGYKQSGFGGHDKSIHAHDQYTEMKTTWIVLKPRR